MELTIDEPTLPTRKEDACRAVMDPDTMYRPG